MNHPAELFLGTKPRPQPAIMVVSVTWPPLMHFPPIKLRVSVDTVMATVRVPPIRQGETQRAAHAWKRCMLQRVGFHWKANSKSFMIFPQVKCCLSIWLLDVGMCSCSRRNCEGRITWAEMLESCLVGVIKGNFAGVKGPV